jgi:multidrug efflux system membrane fusion protein
LKTRIDGQIMQVNFQEGQDVKAGQLLLLIDPRPYQVALAQAEATLQKDEAQLTNAKAQYERNKVLYEQGVIAKQDLDTLEASFGTFEGTIASDKAAIESAKLNLTYCRIVSPINGRVGLRQVDPGNYVTAAGNTPMLTITQLHPISVVFTLPEDQLQQVAQQMKNGVLEVDAYSRDDQTKLATGTLLTINNQIDQTTGTVQLKATFDNPENTLWPNQFVNAHLLLKKLKDAITAPASAMQRGPDGNYAYVVDTQNTVEMRPVKLDLTQGNTVVIASGLQGGERVVTDGQEKLQAGMKVAPQAPAHQRSGSSGSIGSQT